MEKIEKEGYFFTERQKLLLHMADLLWEDEQITEMEKNKLKNLIQSLQKK